MSSLTVLRDAVQEAYGLPCDDFDPECAGCRAWKALFVTREQFERLRAENARLKEALEKIANYLPMFDYVVNDDYGKPDISKPGSPFDRGRAQEAEHLSSIARAALQNKGGE